jgi:hypothetical protein
VQQSIKHSTKRGPSIDLSRQITCKKLTPRVAKVPFSGAAKQTTTSRYFYDLSGGSRNRDSLAKRDEFELPVPISEQPDDNMMSGSGAQTKCRDRPRLKRLVVLYGQQHSKEILPSCAMNDIATDVAAAIK